MFEAVSMPFSCVSRNKSKAGWTIIGENDCFDWCNQFLKPIKGLHGFVAFVWTSASYKDLYASGSSLVSRFQHTVIETSGTDTHWSKHMSQIAKPVLHWPSEQRVFLLF